MDLGDRFTYYCVLDEAGEVMVEQKVATTKQALKQAFGRIHVAAWRWRPGRILPGSAGC